MAIYLEGGSLPWVYLYGHFPLCDRPYCIVVYLEDMFSTICSGAIPLFYNLPWLWLLFVVAGLLLARGYVVRIRNEAKIKQHGGRAPEYGGWLPLGMQSTMIIFDELLTRRYRPVIPC